MLFYCQTGNVVCILNIYTNEMLLQSRGNKLISCLFLTGEDTVITRGTWFYESWQPLDLEVSEVLEKTHLSLFIGKKNSDYEEDAKAPKKGQIFYISFIGIGYNVGVCVCVLVFIHMYYKITIIILFLKNKTKSFCLFTLPSPLCRWFKCYDVHLYTIT